MPRILTLTLFLCVESRKEMCVQGCLLAHVSAPQPARACGHLRSLARAQGFYSCEMLDELLPTIKAATFSERLQASILSSFRKKNKSCSDQSRTED